MALWSALSARCVASAWTIWPSVARRTCGEFFPPMRDIIIKRARTWLYRKMHSNNGLSNSLAGSPLFPSWPVYITDTSGYDFRKGHGLAAIGTLWGFARFPLYVIKIEGDSP